MICNGCGNKNAAYTKTGFEDVGHGKRKLFEICDCCGYAYSAVYFPDVYWDGKEEHGLADDPVTGKPRVFGSKGEKAKYLKERHLSEAGDKYHGAMMSALDSGQTSDNSREAAFAAIRHVRSMGKDQRQKELRRILKEGY